MSDCNAPDNLPSFLPILMDPLKMWSGKDDSELEYQFEDAKRDAFPLINTNEIFQKAVQDVCGQDAESLLQTIKKASDLKSTFNNGVNAILNRTAPIRNWYRTILGSRPTGASRQPMPYNFAPFNVWPLVVDRLAGVTGAFQSACANITNINNENLKCNSNCLLGALPSRLCEDGADTPGVSNPPKWDTSLACSEKTVIDFRLQMANKYDIATRMFACNAIDPRFPSDIWDGIDITNESLSWEDISVNIPFTTHNKPGIDVLYYLDENSSECKGKYRIIIYQYLGDNLSSYVQPSGPGTHEFLRGEEYFDAEDAVVYTPYKLLPVLDKTIEWSSYQEGVKKTEDLAQDIFDQMLKSYGELLDNAVKASTVAINNVNKFLVNLKTAFKDLTENPEFAKAVTLEWIELIGSFAAIRELYSCPPEQGLCANEAYWYLWHPDRNDTNSYWYITDEEARCINQLLENLQTLTEQEWPIGTSTLGIGNLREHLPAGCEMRLAGGQNRIFCEGGPAEGLTIAEATGGPQPIVNAQTPSIINAAITAVRNQTPGGDASKGQFNGKQCSTAILTSEPNTINLAVDALTGALTATVRYKFLPCEMWRQVRGVGAKCNAENIHKLMQSIANALTATIPPGCDLSVFHNLVMGQTSSVMSEEFIGSPGSANSDELVKRKSYCSYTFPNRQNNNERDEDGKIQILPDDCADYPQIFPQDTRYSLLITIWLVTWAINRRLKSLLNTSARGKQVWMTYYESRRFFGTELFE